MAATLSGKKPPGRPKGTPNKRTTEFRTRVDELCEEHGFDLLKVTVLQAQGTDATLYDGLDPKDRATHMSVARGRLIDYSYPKLKALEVTNTEPVQIVIKDMTPST